ncbi:MAG: hypothetical protein WC765_01965 [Phycisphaerae bacterium]
MNKEQRLVTQLSQIKNILEDAKAILQWHKLRVFETSLNPSNKVFLQDDTIQQLEDKKMNFWSLSANIHTTLQSKTISGNKYSEYKKEFTRLCMQFYYLGSDVRVY